MPGIRVWVVVGLLALSTLVSTPVSAADLEPERATVYSPAFVDVPNDHLFAGPIRALHAAGVTLGCNHASTRYCPERAITRGEMAAFLDRALDLPESNSIDFTDDDGNTFEEAIQRLASAGITKGCNPPTNSRYCPERAITRGEMAAFLARGLDLPTPKAVPSGVHVVRSATTRTGIGAALTVCRGTTMSLVVRSVTGGVPGLPDLTAYRPSFESLTAGEFEGARDRWVLPAGEGCDSIDVSWDPTVNILTSPLSTLDVVSPFGYRFHPILGYTRLHAGTDLEASFGDPVFAATSGIVTEAGAVGDYGNLVEISHLGGLSTRYAHLSEVAVSVGDVVEGGSVVGTVGCTGLCTAPHLHFETREFGEPVNPLDYLD